MAPAVENALRYEQQSATAEALQRSLLPTALEPFVGVELAARYVPGSDGIRIGGDWYDAVPLPSGRLMIAIGDVVGHGIRAATWMGRLRTLVQFCALDGLDPAAVLARLNDYCFSVAGLRHGDRDRRDLRSRPATCSSSRAPATRRCSCVGRPARSTSCGRGGARRCARSSGPSSPRAEIALGPGDLLVLYTDGLVERRGEEFDAGIDRLVRRAARRAPATPRRPPTTSPTTLLGPSRPADDVAVLLLAPMPVGADLDLVLASEAAGARRAAPDAAALARRHRAGARTRPPSWSWR